VNVVTGTEETVAEEERERMKLAVHFIQQEISGKEKKMVTTLNNVFEEKLWKM
jgi:hypothetical protein